MNRAITVPVLDQAFNAARAFIPRGWQLIGFGSVIRSDFHAGSDVDLGLLVPKGVPDEQARSFAAKLNALGLRVGNRPLQFTSFKHHNGATLRALGH